MRAVMRNPCNGSDASAERSDECPFLVYRVPDQVRRSTDALRLPPSQSITLKTPSRSGSSRYASNGSNGGEAWQDDVGATVVRGDLLCRELAGIEVCAACRPRQPRPVALG